MTNTPNNTNIDLIDTHCHINLNAYTKDRDKVIRRADANGVRRIIIPGIDLETVQEGLNLSTQYDGIFVASGIHPNSTADFSDDDLMEVEKLAQTPKIVAIGEIGLDYHWDKSPKELQKRAFEAQLALATKLELPVIIHNREASEDTMDILEAWAADLPESLQARPGVLHSFSAPPAIAERALNAGFYLGFTGPITFKKADELREIARDIPNDRILVETDGPFLTPSPHRGERNEPGYIPLIVDRLAALKGMTNEEMGRITTENAERLFDLAQNQSV